jgi:hypothetical protein
MDQQQQQQKKAYLELYYGPTAKKKVRLEFFFGPSYIVEKRISNHASA